MKRLVAAALEVARFHVGTREQGANRGKAVEAYLRSIGLGPGHPWCAAFVYYCIDTAASAAEAPNPFPRTGWCPSIAAWADRNGILHREPFPGDVFLLYGRGSGGYRARHTGFVTGVVRGRVETVEGNTNLGGSAEGIGVFARSRPVTDSLRFVQWSKQVREPQAPRPVYTLLGPDGTPQERVPPLEVRDGRAYVRLRALGEFLGFKRITWDNAEQRVSFDGTEIPVEVALVDGHAEAGIRDTAQAMGLALDVDMAARTVRLVRPGGG